MYQFWETIIQPVAEAVNAERIVEIGALRAQNTDNIIKFGAENCVVHVIDPAPSVPDEHWLKYGERVVFHVQPGDAWLVPLTSPALRVGW